MEQIGRDAADDAGDQQVDAGKECTADGPEREAIIQRMKRLSVAYAPYKVTGHRVATDLMHAPVTGYRRHPFMRDFFRYVDVDPALQP